MSTRGRLSGEKLSSPFAIASASLTIFSPGRSPAVFYLQSGLRLVLSSLFRLSHRLCGVTQARRGKQTTLTSKLITKRERSNAFSKTSFLAIPLHFAHTLQFYPQTLGYHGQNTSKSGSPHTHHATAAIFRSSTQFFIAPPPPRIMLSKNDNFCTGFTFII